MTTGSPQIIERLEWEGMVSAPTALIVAIVLALVAGFFLWRERDVIGRGWAAAFWVMRTAAFVCALWMLAGPTQLKVERTTTSQAIAILADGSESMDVVEHSAPAEAVRWALAINPSSKDSPIQHCDRLAVALGAALTHCQQFGDFVKEHRPVKQLEIPFNSVTTAAERATIHAEKLQKSLRGEDESLADRSNRITALVDGPVADSLDAIRSALKSSDRTASQDFPARVDQLVESLSSARRRTLVLSADLAGKETAKTIKSQAEMDTLSRRDKAARTLDALESRIDGELSENIHIERFRFDRSATPVSVENGWAKAMGGMSDDLTTVGDNGAALDSASQPVAGQGTMTNVSSALQRLTTQRTGQAIRLAMILSDGRHNDVDAAAPQEIAAQLVNVPVYVVPIGNSVQERDLVLHRVEAPTTVAEKDSAVIDIIVTGFDCEGQKSSVVLKHNGSEVDRKPIEFSGSRGDYRVRFTVPAKELGWQEYVVEVEPIAEETHTANNFQPVSFEVVRDKLRVLLADGVPRWEYRYLNQLFRRDEHVEFDELLFYPRVHGTGKLVDRPEFPRDVEGWAAYDIVILGDIGPTQFPAACQKSLDEFIRKRGGNLIVVAGQNSMPAAFAGQSLMELLPVEPAKDILPQQGYVLKLTDEGRFNSALLIADTADESRQEWDKVYHRFPVFGLSEYSRPKATARTLIEAVPETGGNVADGTDRNIDTAFLCWQRVGAGRVAYLAAPETYRLRWRRGDRMHHRFWGQFLRWITAANVGSGTEAVRLQTDHSRYSPGEPVQVTVWLKDTSGRPVESETIQAEARTFDGAARSVELAPDNDVPGRYFATINDLPAGAYQIGVRGQIIDQLLPKGSDAANATATVTVRGSDNIESLNTQCNRALLEQIAQMTGGQVIPPTAIDEVLDLVAFKPQVNEIIQRKPLWNRWSSMLIVLGCLFTEWTVRKSKGLV